MTDDDYCMFQFMVDNAASIERSVALLLAELPTHPLWVRYYLSITPNNNIQFSFFQRLLYTMPLPPTPTALHRLRDLLQVSQKVPDRWLLKAACDTQSPEILAIMLEVQGVEEYVDEWICLYVAKDPVLHEMLLHAKMRKQQ